MTAKTSLPVLLTILMLAPPAGATTMYSYVGDVFHAVSGNYSTSDRITGSLTLADGFVPNTQFSGPKDLRPGIIAYSFTDGHQTLTESNSTLGSSLVSPYPPRAIHAASKRPCRAVCRSRRRVASEPAR